MPDFIPRPVHPWVQAAATIALVKAGKSALNKERSPGHRASRESRAHGEEVARQLLEAGLVAAELTIEDLPELPGSDVRKVAIAVNICQYTIVKMQWISDHLWMRSAANASQQIRRFRLTPPNIPPALRKWIASL